MSGPRMHTPINSNNRRPNNFGRIPPLEKPPAAQHEDLIRFICDSWNKVSQELLNQSPGHTLYHEEQESERLKDFEPFDLEAYWGRKIVKNLHHQPHHTL